MKKISIIIIFATLIVAGFMLTTCVKKGEVKHHQEVEQAKDKSGKEYTSAYVCEMHCEGSGSEEPGNCPKCGMEYIKTKPLWIENP